MTENWLIKLKYSIKTSVELQIFFIYNNNIINIIKNNIEIRDAKSSIDFRVVYLK